MADPYAAFSSPVADDPYAAFSEPVKKPKPKEADPRSLLGIIGRRGNEGLGQMQQGGQRFVQAMGANGNRAEALGAALDVAGGGWKALTAAPSGYVERAAGPAWNALTGGPSSSMGDFTENMLGFAAGPKGPPTRPPLPRPAPQAVKMGEMLKSNPIQKVGSVLDAGATPAAEKVRAAALAKVLAQKQALTEAETLAASRKAADVPLRAKMEEAAQAQAAQGIGVSDIPEAQSLVAFMKGQLNPRGKVVTVPTSEQARLYRDVIGVLSPKGAKRPSLETIQNLRRKIADPVHGDPEGYSAIADMERQKIVKDLHDVEDAYTGGAARPTRENYAAYKAADEQAQEMAKFRDKINAQTTLLENLPSRYAAAKAKTIVDQLANRGVLTPAEYEEFTRLAVEARDAAGKAKFRKQVALWAAGLAGISATGTAIGGHAAGILP